MTTPRRSSPGGVYGFRLHGVPNAEHLLLKAPASWPPLALERLADGARPDHEEVTESHARLWLSGGGGAYLDRQRRHAGLWLPDGATDGALVHPFLAPVALIMSRWLGREGFHGGGVVVDGGVWAVLGDKTAGKSTTLAWLEQAGVPVFSDDVLIIEGERVFAGPRSIDLRREAAERLGAGEPLGRVGMRDRWRLPLRPVPAELPLRGWVTLAWGDRLGVEPVRGAERFAALLPHRGVRLIPAAPSALVRFSGLPQLRLTRPRAWASLPAAADLLLEALAG